MDETTGAAGSSYDDSLGSVGSAVDDTAGRADTTYDDTMGSVGGMGETSGAGGTYDDMPMGSGTGTMGTGSDDPANALDDVTTSSPTGLDSTEENR